MSKVRVRIAPSPTGIPHIGNTRTALFNFLFARHNKGTFILRIDDTDQKRIVSGAREAISEILNWLDLSPDETFVQSERLDIYREHITFLLNKKIAFEKEGAVWVRVPKGKIISWKDAVGDKNIEFKTDDIEEFVILKSDGFPTYHLASVVDDHLMDISHVIRGEEWISSTPKHLFLYESFGWTPPVFAHLPIILGSDKAKLSKRHGAESVLDYRKKGYLKEALLNYMALLGWRFAGAIGEEGTPHVVPGREIMSLDLMIYFFELKDINISNPIFDAKKLEWFNGVWIRKIAKDNPDDFKSRLIKFIGDDYSIELVEKTILLVQERMRTLADYLRLCKFFFKDPDTYEIDISSNKDLIQKIHDSLRKVDKWKDQEIGDAMLELAKAMKVANSEFFMILRVAITGKKISPPLNESMEILGKEKVLERLERIISP